jgi:hypothetical protein
MITDFTDVSDSDTVFLVERDFDTVVSGENAMLAVCVPSQT